MSAAADSPRNDYYQPAHKNYMLLSKDNDGDGEPETVIFAKKYFGRSGIDVRVEIYSSPEMDLSFWIGEDSANLEPEHVATRDKLVLLFNHVHDYLTLVDNCANTTYDGVTKQYYPLGTTEYYQSDINKYNQASFGDTIDVSKQTYEMLQIAQEMYLVTDGKFNPAVYRLVDLWGFSSRLYTYGNYGLPYDRRFDENGYPLPDKKYKDAFSEPEFTTFAPDKVVLNKTGDGDNATYSVTKNVMPVTVDGVTYQQWLDLGGIAKGYAVDGIKEMLSEIGLERYYVTAGGSSTVFGWEYDGGNSVLYTENPFGQYAPLLGFEVGKCSVSTSGQYVRRYVTNGVEYAHIIDGVRGEPAQTGLKSVMVVVPESEGLWAGRGDCLTTALTVMGRDKAVEFINGYLKEHNIQVVAVYEPLDTGANKQILSNVDKDDISYKGYGFDDFNWVLKEQDGIFVYDGNAKFGATANPNTVIVIVLASLFGAAVVAIVVYHFVRGHKKSLQNVKSARRDKPFKPADVGAYLVVALLVAVLFAVFFAGGESENWQTVAVTDGINGEQLFLYNAVRNEYQINNNSINGWTIEVESVADGIKVTFSREIDGEKHFNVIGVTRGTTPSVKMLDSKCGRRQDCMHTFGEVTLSGGTIVCSPNNLKVTTSR
ncbi:MAG: FAD:protein FMN transferase [Corallococcus sp.]|nr:FAD:protein FMN transferase [Corallococcus sp.]